LNENAAVITYEEYHPYGTTAYQLRNKNVNTAAKRYRYTGMERDEESGMSYHSARYYLPWLGRWLNSDPIENQIGTNKYEYVLNNPIIFSDNDGLSPKEQINQIKNNQKKLQEKNTGELVFGDLGMGYKKGDEAGTVWYGVKTSKGALLTGKILRVIMFLTLVMTNFTMNWVNSGFRTKGQQESQVKTNKQNAASSGYSRHQDPEGIAIDLSVGGNRSAKDRFFITDKGSIVRYRNTDRYIKLVSIIKQENIPLIRTVTKEPWHWEVDIGQTRQLKQLLPDKQPSEVWGKNGSDAKTTIGLNLEEARLANGLSIREVTEKLRAKKRQRKLLSKIESGKILPKPRLLKKLAAIYGVSPSLFASKAIK
jgi:RHS repeat-associated protein